VRNLPPCVLVLLAVLPLAGVTACDSTVAPGDVALGVEFTLAPGESALAGDDGLPVTFASVTEDSRCPKDAVCVWAGQVVVDVAAGSSGEHHALKPGEAAEVRGFRLKLVKVEPYPSSQGTIRPSDYRATFVVERT
jgi:hypothetical protein